MIRFPALFAVVLCSFTLLTGCAEQPLDAPVSEQLEVDPAPLPPAVETTIAEEPITEIADDVASEPPAKSPLRSIFNALKVGTAEALDETDTP